MTDSNERAEEASGGDESLLTVIIAFSANLLIAIANRTFENGMAELEEAVAGLSPADAVVEAGGLGLAVVNDCARPPAPSRVNGTALPLLAVNILFIWLFAF